MSNYKATFEIGWLNETIEGDSPEAIIEKLEEIQDLDCLLRMGYEEEGRKGRKELDKLAEFLKKYRNGDLVIEDIERLNISLSIGDLRCKEITEVENGE